ncbi:glycosyltransferase [Nitratireductor sp. GCM10026969]|uniref:glycosyltransferase n=1 Tax=Nitratireductor sp. GCM10026969 TaxID=3252645 RepID=UPI0036173B42
MRAVPGSHVTAARPGSTLSSVSKRDRDRFAFDVSIIVPTYNRAHFLAECLDALLAEVRPIDELIVVDDGSTDETLNVLSNYADRVIVLTTPNRGKAAALNLALERARCTLVWIVDDDDIVCKGALETLLALFASCPGPDIVYGRHLRFISQGRKAEPRILGTGYWSDCDPESFLIATLEDLFVHHPGMIVRRSLYQEVGPFNEKLARSVDYDMLIRLARKGRVASTNAIVFHQRLHDGDRGPAKKRSVSANRDAVWIDHDKTIFRAIYADLPLSAYLPHREVLTSEDHRRALLQRGTIMARKKLWTLAFRDFVAAPEQSGAPLTHEECAILRKATGSKYGCLEILSDPDISLEMTALAQRSRLGKALVRALARGLIWRIRRAALTLNFRECLGLAVRVFQWVRA